MLDNLVGQEKKREGETQQTQGGESMSIHDKKGLRKFGGRAE